MGDVEFQRPRKVCLCKGVDEKTIVESVKMGNNTVEAVAHDTLATTGCGTCYPAVEKIIKKTLQQKQE